MLILEKSQFSKKIEFPVFFFVYLSKSAGNCKLADKQKTTKVREIQITKILKVSMYHIFCALI